MSSLAERISVASAGAAGGVVILSANPIHDTGGGQRSAQLALEWLERDFAVVFVSHGEVTETVDLRLRFDQPRLVQVPLADVAGGDDARVLDGLLGLDFALVLSQIPVREWLPVLARAREAGAVTAYDCIDRWDSELGRGWYRPANERAMADASEVLIASASELVDHVERLTGREAHLVPNAFNARVFAAGGPHARPRDLPASGRIAIYVGALWGGWMDWSLIREMARAQPGTHLVFVGDHRGEGRGLPKNCVFLGLKPQAELPAYLAHADVALLPWRVDPVTQATSPLKVYEYVATGTPVVAPTLDPLRGVPGVTLVERSGFGEAVRSTSRTTLTDDERARMAAFAGENSWSRRVDRLQAIATRAPAAPAVHTRAQLSVVIPAFNHERYVGEAVASVRTQTLEAGELVVVDDGSTDGTREALEAAGFPGMRVVHQPNRGAHAAINRAIALSRGDYIAILNSDDAFEPTRLEHAWGVARATGAALVIGTVQLVGADGRPLDDAHDTARWYRDARAMVREGSSFGRVIKRHNLAVTTSNFFLHRELWRRLGGFAAYRYVHDYDFLLRALDLCPERVRYIDALADVRYRVHASNTIREDVERALAERAGLLRVLRRPMARMKRAVRRRTGARDVAAAIRGSGSLDPCLVPGSAAVGGPGAPSLRGGGRVADPTSPLRVGIVVGSLDQGGLEEIVGLLAYSMRALGAAPQVLCSHSGGMVAERLKLSGLPITIGRGRPDDWRSWAERVAPDVISTHYASAGVVRVLGESGVPLVETIHNTYGWHTDKEWAGERAKLSTLTATIAVSETAGRYFRLHAGASPSHVIPNAVHPARAARAPRRFARALFDLPEEAPVFVHLGRVTGQKNMPGLLAAFADVLRDVPTARLLLTGPPDDAATLVALKARFPALFARRSVRHIRSVDAVGVLLSAADAFVSNSFYEGWSVAASEAAWVGLPLVLSECGGSRELVGDGGARGRVVPNPVGDPLSVDPASMSRPGEASARANRRAMARAMLDVAGSLDEWRGRSDEIRAWAREALAPARMARAYLDVFERLSRS